MQVRIGVIIHATEDRHRIASSLADALDIRPDALQSSSSEGHYHNTITTLTASLRKGEARSAVRRLRDSLPNADLDHIRDTVPARTDGSTLYIRLDKQEMVSGRIRLNDSGAVRIRITIPPHGGRAGDALLRLLD